jgi:2-dehydro-3-deoxygalactonokinase
MKILKELYWIAVDWGSSNLRVWALDRRHKILDSFSSNDGMLSLETGDFEPLLLKQISNWVANDVNIPVLCCGMVGAKQGWLEAPYATVPYNLMQETDSVKVICSDNRLDVRILGGLKQNNPADVMRGEETQIRGFLSDFADFDGIVCLPGTHTKWVHVSAGEVVSFRTFISGELFALMSEYSVLKYSVNSEGWSDQEFKSAVSESISNPQKIFSHFFNLRADDLLNNVAKPVLRSKLSGYIIGAELAGAKPYWLGQNVVILADNNLSKTYKAALEGQGIFAQEVDATKCTLDGLAQAFSLIHGRH